MIYDTPKTITSTDLIICHDTSKLVIILNTLPLQPHFINTTGSRENHTHVTSGFMDVQSPMYIYIYIHTDICIYSIFVY